VGANAAYLVHQGIYNRYKTDQLAPAERRTHELEARIRSLQAGNGGQHNAHTYGHKHNPATHVHGHEDINTLVRELNASRDTVARLRENERRDHALYFKHEMDVFRLQGEINVGEYSLSGLSQERDYLTERQTARRNRKYARDSKPGTFVQGALSSENARLLDDNIDTSHALTNSELSRMINLVSRSCYPSFLTQIESQVSALGLADRQREALSQIIEKMKEHQRDLSALQGATSELRRLENALQAAQTEQTSKQKQLGTLTSQNSALAEENERLNETLVRLTHEHRNLQRRRDFFGIYSATHVGVCGTGAISAYFLLQVGGIALVPVVNIAFAAVAGAILLVLAITAIVSAIQTAYKKAELDRCEQAIRNNTNNVRNNNLTMEQSQGIDLPNLIARISLLSGQISNQSLTVQQAQSKADASFNEASAIRADSPGFGYDPQNRFFPLAASAPANALANDDALANEALPVAVVVEAEHVSAAENKI